MIRAALCVLATALAGVVLAGTPSGPAWAAHHEPVIQVASLDVMPGKLEAYRQELKKLMGVMSRLESSGELRAWQVTAGGPDTGTVIVGVEFPNAATWAADTGKLAADEEWQQIVGGLDDLRTLNGTSIWRDVSVTPVAAGSGSVLVITGVDVNPGQLESYRKRLDSARSIAERLGVTSQVRVWHAELAGENTGDVAVGAEYDSLEAYVEDEGKLAMDEEWQKLLGELQSMRSVAGRWVYTEITP